VSHLEFVAGQRQAKVSLGETLHSAAKRLLHIFDQDSITMHRDHGAFGEIDHQAGGQGKLIQDALSSIRCCHARSENYQRVIHVLEDRTRCILSKQMAQDVILQEQPLQQISH
jgi:hypothetical protein